MGKKLKAFETWWKIQQDNKDSQSWKKLHRSTKDVTKDGWRAALEWMLTMKREDDGDDGIEDSMSTYYKIPDWGIDMIEEELEEK